jgi:hypothetical protein
MPTKKKRRMPSDVNQLAALIVALSTKGTTEAQKGLVELFDADDAVIRHDQERIAVASGRHERRHRRVHAHLNAALIVRSSSLPPLVPPLKVPGPLPPAPLTRFA